MADNSNIPKSSYLPKTRTQNPAPLSQTGQESVSVLQSLTAEILQSFVEILPSNYVSQTNGPYYILQFQSVAEQLAKIQLAFREIGLESNVDFARPEYLWQMVGVYVFPDLTKTPEGIPEIDGDLTYRNFLKNMIRLLLEGSVEEAIQEGLGLLTDAQIRVLAKVDFSHEPTSGWGLKDQNTFEVNILDKTTWTDPDTGEIIEGDFGTGFPDEVFKLFRNNQRILRALKPASKLYDYRHLFLEVFSDLVDEYSSAECTWYYEDYRKFCLGIKEITSSSGVAKDGLLYDNTLFFFQIEPGQILEFFNGPNSAPINGGKDDQRLGVHRVKEVLRLPFGAEDVERDYITSPTGLSGKVTIGNDGELTDGNQDFSSIVEGEILSILDGPNTGDFRIEFLLGPNGGYPEKVSGSSDSVRIGPGVIRTESKIVFDAKNQEYKISVERLGTQTPKFVFGENVSSQFWL